MQAAIFSLLPVLFYRAQREICPWGEISHKSLINLSWISYLLIMSKYYFSVEVRSRHNSLGVHEKLKTHLIDQ